MSNISGRVGKLNHVGMTEPNQNKLCNCEEHAVLGFRGISDEDLVEMLEFSERQVQLLQAEIAHRQSLYSNSFNSSKSHSPDSLKETWKF